MLSRISATFCLAALSFIGAGALANDANPFDPSGFIKSTEVSKTAAAAITATGIYRIDGRRYFQFAAGTDEVFLPAIGDRPDIRLDVALCRPHLPLTREAIMIRDGLAPEAWVKEREPEIFPLILQCRDGSIKGPVVEIETKDGATMKVEAKTRDSKEREAKGKQAID